MVVCLILCAGYATRLYPITKNKAKSLVEISGESLLNHIVKKVLEIDLLEKIVIVTNHKFYNQFLKWKNEFEIDYKLKVLIKILDDSSTSNENRLGAIKDLLFAIEKEKLNSEMLILAGDNILDFSLKDFYSEFKYLNKNLIAVLNCKSFEEVKNKHGVCLIDSKNQVKEFYEKPLEPLSKLKSVTAYLFKPEIALLLKKYLDFGNSDAVGYFLGWLVKNESIYSYEIKGNVIDIGNLERYNKNKNYFS